MIGVAKWDMEILLGRNDAKQAADAAVRLDLGLLVGSEHAFACLSGEAVHAVLGAGLKPSVLGLQEVDPMRPPARFVERASPTVDPSHSAGGRASLLGFVAAIAVKIFWRQRVAAFGTP